MLCMSDQTDARFFRGSNILSVRKQLGMSECEVRENSVQNLKNAFILRVLTETFLPPKSALGEVGMEAELTCH